MLQILYLRYISTAREMFPHTNSRLKFNPCHFTDFAAAAAAAAKSLQSCPTLCDPIDSSPTRLPCPWDSQGKNTGDSVRAREGAGCGSVGAVSGA